MARALITTFTLFIWGQREASSLSLSFSNLFFFFFASPIMQQQQLFMKRSQEIEPREREREKPKVSRQALLVVAVFFSNVREQIIFPQPPASLVHASSSFSLSFSFFLLAKSLWPMQFYPPVRCRSALRRESTEYSVVYIHIDMMYLARAGLGPRHRSATK